MTNNIKTARKRSHMTQKACADIVGVTLRAWQAYEQGVREPKFELLCQIADLLHVTTDYLLGRDTGEPDAFEQIAAQFSMSALERKIVENYLSLPESIRGDFMDFLRKSVEEVMAENGD